MLKVTSYSYRTAVAVAKRPLVVVCDIISSNLQSGTSSFSNFWLLITTDDRSDRQKGKVTKQPI